MTPSADPPYGLEPLFLRRQRPARLHRPGGYSWFSNFFRGVGTFFRNLFASPLLRSILQIAASVAATIACGGNVACGMVAAALISGAVTGLSGGKLSEMLRASAMAFMAAVAFNVVGGVSTAIGGTAGFAVKVAGHAGVGCLTAVASGGSCGSGAASAAVSAAATPLVGEVFQNPRGNVSDLIGGTATHAAIGGFASVAGGGKFENGAVTAAFGYLFNAVATGRDGRLCIAPGPANGCGEILEGGGSGGGGRGGAALDFGKALAVALGLDAASNGGTDAVHGNSSASMRGTELYCLVNKSSGEIDKIGITSNPTGRYSQAYLEAENVYYERQAYYTWRYAAMVDENIRLTWYQIDHGHLPRLNRVTR